MQSRMELSMLESTLVLVKVDGMLARFVIITFAWIVMFMHMKVSCFISTRFLFSSLASWTPLALSKSIADPSSLFLLE